MQMAGIYASMFGGTGLDPYAFVGITEHMVLSLSLFARQLEIHLPVDSVGRENATPRRSYPPGWEQALREFEDAAAADHRLYQIACRRLLSLQAAAV